MGPDAKIRPSPVMCSENQTLNFEDYKSVVMVIQQVPMLLV